ncbi:uncharacterized protein LOC124170109 [Ischnura elegans]|uniref:uncharacterized protein LOC124170109 n=1 Tax=Ischnura elegans TaxID=197161 RepID=UPI001ED89A83|nr:uncharacterized protein LOC124170109 [Ischnura elegans]
MEAIKLEPSDESEQTALSNPFENKQTIGQLRMTFKAAIQRIDVHLKSDSGRKTARRQLTEEELEARRRINRIRMAATRAARTLEQIEADRMSQRARMAALRRRRSEQELKSVLSEQGVQGEVDVVEVSRNNVSVEPRVRRSSSSRRQLTPEELEIRRRINRLRVAMMRAERTEEQIEADRKAQRLRMAELRRRRSEEQIAADLESQRARMAALRRERRSRLREDGGAGSVGSVPCRPIVKQEAEEEPHPALAPHPAGFQPQSTYPGAANHTVETAVLPHGAEWPKRVAAAERRRHWRLKLSPEEAEARRRRAAERMRTYRATLRATLSPEELQARKWKAAERMRQWRASLSPEELARMRAKGLERARKWRSQRGSSKAGVLPAEDGRSNTSPGLQEPCAAQCEAASVLRWERAAQDQSQGGRPCGSSSASFKDCVVPPYFSVPTSRDCENGCLPGEWPSIGSGCGTGGSGGYAPPRFLPHLLPPTPGHHAHHHHDVATVSASEVSSTLSTMADHLQHNSASTQQQLQQQLQHHHGCSLQPPSPCATSMLPPLATTTMMAPPPVQRPPHIDWPPPRPPLLGFEGFSSPAVLSPSPSTALDDPRAGP